MSDDEIRDLLLNPRTPFEEQLADRLIAEEKARLRRQHFAAIEPPCDDECDCDHDDCSCDCEESK